MIIFSSLKEILRIWKQVLDCYTLSLLSLWLTLSIIIIFIIIIIITSAINAILEEKEKAKGWEGGFPNKTVWTCLYACYLYKNFFVCLFAVWSFSCKKSFFFRIYSCVCKFDENKNENWLKKNLSQGKVISIWLIRALKLQLLLLLFSFHQFLIAIISLTSSNGVFSLPFLWVMLYFVYDDQKNDDSSI